MRNFGKTTKATLANALAFVHITGHKNGLHLSTRLEMTSDLVDFVARPYKIGDFEGTTHRYELTDAGREIASTSKLWKAHAKLTEMGFRLEERRLGARRYKPGYLSYRHTEHPFGNGPDMRGAFISKGSAYAQREPGAEIPEGGRRWDYVKVEV